MARRIKKKDVDAEILDVIFVLEREWKKIQSIGAQSIERTAYSRYIESLARAKYLYLLREARHRNMSAMRK